LQETIIGSYQPGTKINIEVDVIARYLERLIQGGAIHEQAQSSNITEAFLTENGFVTRNK
jgi:riboflavin synthase